MGAIEIEKKPKQQPKLPRGMAPLTTYRVCEVMNADDGDSKYVEVGHILVSLPCPFGGTVILNCTTGKALIWSGALASLLERTRLLRDYETRSVVIAFDDNELPA